MRIESATASGATANVSAGQHSHGHRADRHGSDGPRAERHGSEGPRRSEHAGNEDLRGLHLGQIRRMIAAQGGSESADMEALQGLTSRLNDVMERLDALGGVVGQTVPGGTGRGTTTAQASAGTVNVNVPGSTITSIPVPAGSTVNINLPAGFSVSTSGSTATTSSGAAGSATGGAGGTAATAGAGTSAGGTSGAGGTGSTASTASSTFSLLYPFQGPTDFGSITINGVTTNFGTIDAQGGLTSNQVASSLVNIINSNPDNTVTAQQRDNKIMLISKTAGTPITIDDISMGSTSGTLAGFAGFLDGMSGTGTLMSNPISPVRR